MPRPNKNQPRLIPLSVLALTFIGVFFLLLFQWPTDSLGRVLGTQIGSFTTTKIGIANLETSGSPVNVGLTLYQLGGSGLSNPPVPPVYPQGVSFVTDSSFSNGRYSAVADSDVPVSVAVLTQNSAANTADTYTGVSHPDISLYGPLIFNKHVGWESIFYCQNAGASPTSIQAEVYKTGEASPRITLSQTADPNQSVTWDLADDGQVQAAWPGGNGEFGFVKFTSSNPIACIVDNQLMTSPSVQSQYNAVTASLAHTELYIPLIFHGHGTSSVNRKDFKWNSGISIVNINSSPTSVQVVYTSGSYVKTCTKMAPANGHINWYAPEVGTGPDGWNCAPSGPLEWSYPGGPTFGSVKLTSGLPVLAISNSNRYDTGVNLAVGYSSIAVSPGVATNRVVCPLVFNKNPATDWTTGVRVVNVGSVAADVTWKMVRANVDPNVGGNSVSITKTGIAPGTGQSTFFPEEPSALTNFEGAVFVSASNPSAKIAASSSNNNYGTLGSAAMYDCINY